MKTNLIPALAAVMALSTPVFAQQVPGGHFIENWDYDEDGQVSFEEALERRGDIFTTFDADENGILNAEEYDMFDEARAADMANNEAMAQGMGGMGQGRGHGGMGQGKGMGGMGQGRGMAGMAGMAGMFGQEAYGAGNAMKREFADLNHDGQVTRAEFVDGTRVWFDGRDRNGDGVITAADFGPGF